MDPTESEDVMDFERHRTEIRTQTGLLATGLKDADLRAPVPSCPGWTLGNLVRHIGGGQRWADATLAVCTPFVVDPEVALDAIDEWLELDALPAHFDLTPQKRAVLGAGRRIALEATDADAVWFVDLTGGTITWRRGPGAVAATLRGTLTDLLLAIYRRTDVHDGPVALTGDRDLIDLWLGTAGFG